METRVVKLFPKQFDAINFTSQFGAAVAGVQSGKTFLGTHWVGKKLGEFPKGTGIIVSPTFGVLHQATLKKFFDVFPELRRFYKEQKGQLQLPTGGIVYTRSAEKPLGIEGISADWIWGDEAGQFSLLTWTILRSRVSMTGGQILLTTTPYNMGWLYENFYKVWQGGDKAFSFFTWPSIANPNYPKDFYEAEKKRLPPEEFGRRYMGEFNKMTGLVYDIPERQIIAPIEGLIKKSETRLIGVDWGFRNPAAIVVLYLYDKCWYVVDEWKQAEKTTAEIIQVLHNKIKEHKIFKVFPDPAEPDRIEECKRAGIPVYDTNKDIEGGLSIIRQAIYEKRFFVYNTCTEWLLESSMYHYDMNQEKKEFKEIPEKWNDHLMDATRYAIYSYNPVKFNYVASPPLPKYYPEIGL